MAISPSPGHAEDMEDMGSLPDRWHVHHGNIAPCVDSLGECYAR